MLNHPTNSKLDEVLVRVGRADPLFAALRKVSRRPIRVALAASLTHAAVVSASWLAVRAAYPSRQLEGLLDARTVHFSAFIWLIFVPAIWAYYVWLPAGTLKVVQDLCLNGIIDYPTQSADVQQPSGSSEFKGVLLEDSLVRALGRRIWVWCALGSVVVFTVVHYLSVIPGEITASGGRIPFWYTSGWSTAILQLINAAGVYAFTMFAIRAIAVALEVHGFFGQTSVIKTVYLAHPDQCGGLGSVGSFAIRLAQFAVLIGIWATIMTLIPVARGGRPNFSAGVLAVYALYAFLVPFTLLSLIWPVHAAMREFKHSRLQVLSLEIQELLDSLLEQVIARPKATAEAVAKLEKLQDMYVITTDIPEWPISLPEFKRFSGIALLPALTGTISFVIDLAQNWPF